MVFVYLALFAGLREGEICGLLWEHVDLQKKIIHVKYSFSEKDGLKAPKSRAGERSVPMAPNLYDALLSLRSDQGRSGSGFVLTGTDRPIRPFNAINGWQAIVAEIGLIRADGRHFTFHALRHAAASLWIRSGLAPLAVKKLMGHASIKMTMDVYGHIFPEDDSYIRSAITSAARAAISLSVIEGTLYQVLKSTTHGA
jgi:integrase